jgi:hypothetical protein
MALFMGCLLGQDLATGPQGRIEKREKWRGVGRAQGEKQARQMGRVRERAGPLPKSTKE